MIIQQKLKIKIKFRYGYIVLLFNLCYRLGFRELKTKQNFCNVKKKTNNIYIHIHMYIQKSKKKFNYLCYKLFFKLNHYK